MIKQQHKTCLWSEFKNVITQCRNWNLIILITTIKLLLIPSYYSTDFEVHRNWLAITSSLPISKWYFENTSEWTLDYPPFFGWFEYLLSKFAYYFDSNMLVIDNLNHNTIETILFQRFSVIISDSLFIISTLLLSNYLYNIINDTTTTTTSSTTTNQQKKQHQRQPSSLSNIPWYHDKSFIISSIVILNPGLLMVDHIHFQYNGFLKGILILSIYFLVRGNILIGSILFSVLLNFKHIYMYMAPAFFVYLLKYYCISGSNGGGNGDNSLSILGIKIFNLIKLGLSVILVFTLSLGPFIYMGQIQQLISRLFPFGRGLTHAYWAPNFWSIYNFTDRFLLFNDLYKKLPYFKNIVISSVASGNSVDKVVGNLTSGLVGSDSQTHSILPKITPQITLIITCLFLLPSIYGILKSKNWKNFIFGICQSSFTFFMFGWHVHEKAIIMVTIPMGFLYLSESKSNRFSKLYFILSTVGHYSLFPLLFKIEEIPTRILILSTYTIILYLSFISSSSGNGYGNSKNKPYKIEFGLYWFEKLYLFGIIGLEIFNIYHLIYLSNIEKFSFISLMLTSVYCSIGIIYSYIYSFKIILFNN